MVSININFQNHCKALLEFCRFEKDLAAEALRRNENNSEKALDDLTNPETNSSMQVAWFIYLFLWNGCLKCIYQCWLSWIYSFILNQGKEKGTCEKWMLQLKTLYAWALKDQKVLSQALEEARCCFHSTWGDKFPAFKQMGQHPLHILIPLSLVIFWLSS